MRHYYERVPGLGNVAVSRHAQERCARDRISERAFEAALNAASVPDGGTVVRRTANGVCVVVEQRPQPFKGCALVVTAYCVLAQEGRRRRG